MRLQYILWITLTILGICIAASARADTLRLSMLPLYNPGKIKEMTTPLTEYLGQRTGHKIEVFITSDYSQYEKSLKNGSVHIGYQNPYVYTLVSKIHEAVAMLLKGKNGNRYRGIIIAREDSGLSALSDLKSKKISIVGYTSAGGFLSQKLTLMNAGLNVETDMRLMEAANNKQENVLLNVYTGEADAGFIKDTALHQADSFISNSQIRVIHQCAWLPNWAVSLNRSLPDSFKKDIRDALLDLQVNHPVLNALEANGFKYAEDQDYDSVRKAIGTIIN